MIYTLVIRDRGIYLENKQEIVYYSWGCSFLTVAYVREFHLGWIIVDNMAMEHVLPVRVVATC